VCFVRLTQHTVTSSHTALSVDLSKGQCVLCEVQFRLTLGQKPTDFPATYEPPQKSRQQKVTCGNLRTAPYKVWSAQPSGALNLYTPAPRWQFVSRCIRLIAWNHLLSVSRAPLSFWRVSRRTEPPPPSSCTPLPVFTCCYWRP